MSTPQPPASKGAQARIKQAEVFTRILLMLGHGYDDQSILARLKIDCDLSWTFVELDLVRATAGRPADAWSRGILKLMKLYKLTFDEGVSFRNILGAISPGEAGFWMARLLLQSGRPCNIELIWGVLPKHPFEVHSGMYLGSTYREPIPQRGFAAVLTKERLHLTRSGISPDRFRQLVGVATTKGAPLPLEAKLGKIQMAFANKAQATPIRASKKSSRKAS